MATEIEVRTMHKAMLNTLLKLKRANDKKGVKVEGLATAIRDQRAIMLPEDFAYVQKLVEEADDED